MPSRIYAHFAFAAALLSFAALSGAQVTVIDGPIVSPVNGHYYAVLSNSDWTTAQSAAQAMHGNVATVRSASEEKWIEQTFSAYPYLWLGLYDPTQDDFGQSHSQDFKWIDGEPITYTNWASGEPNDFDGEEYYTQLILTNSSTDSADTWNDMYNAADPEHSPNFYGPDYGLVELLPEPSSLSFLALSALPALLRRQSAKSTCQRGRRKKKG